MSVVLPHQTVLLREAVEALSVKPSGVYVDGTFGRGGHSRAILERLGPHGRLYALDRDPQAIAAAREINDQRLVMLHRSFGELAEPICRAEPTASVMAPSLRRHAFTTSTLPSALSV